jgi:hypothetical protein
MHALATANNLASPGPKLTFLNGGTDRRKVSRCAAA